MKPQLLHSSTKKGFTICFYRDVKAFYEEPLTALIFCHTTSRKTLRPTHPLFVT